MISEIANRGCVLQSVGTESESLLSSFNIVPRNANATHRDVIASALRTLSTRSGGKMDGALRNIQVQVTSASLGTSGGLRIAGQATRNSITLSSEILNTAGQGGRAVAEATVIHEMAHTYGKRSGMEGRYASQVGDVCDISLYCTHKIAQNGAPAEAHGHRREEFAEVLTAFIFDGNRLQTQCPAAYNFMRDEIFDGNPGPPECAPAEFSRSYRTANGEFQNIQGGGMAPSGYEVWIQIGQQLMRMRQLTAMEEARDRQQRQQEQRQQPRGNNGGAPSGQGSEVAPEN